MEPRPSADPNFDVPAADSRVEEAVARRRSERRERTILEGEVTFAGCIDDAAGSEREVMVLTVSGRRLYGPTTAVGPDLLRVRCTSGPPVVVRRSAIVAIGGALRAGGSSGMPDPEGCGPTMGDVLSELAARRSTVRLTLEGGATIGGRIVSCGTDAAVLAAGGELGALYVAFDSVNELSSSDIASP